MGIWAYASVTGIHPVKFHSVGETKVYKQLACLIIFPLSENKLIPRFKQLDSAPKPDLKSANTNQHLKAQHSLKQDSQIV